MNILRKLFSGLILLFAITLQAQQNPHIINIGRDVYKAANKNWSVGEDERGVMYFGNDIGLLESDGMDWKLHRVPNSPIVRAIAVQSHQTIYTGGFEEIGKWERDISGTLKYTSLKHLVKEDILQNENIWKIQIAYNKVYFQSFTRIYVYDGQTIELLQAPGGFMFLLKVGDEYWVQEINGALYRLRENGLHREPGSEFFNGTIVRVILPHGEKNYLFGTSSGEIYLYDGNSYKLWNPNLSSTLQGEELNNGLYSAKHNKYYLGTQLDGVYEVDENGEILNHFSTPTTLRNNTVLSLFEDNLNNIWVAMDRGLAYIRYTEGLSYYKANERDAGAIYHAVFWKDHILLGTNQGVYHAPKEMLNRQDFFSSLRLINGTQGQIWCFAEIDNKLYCGHNNALLQVHPDFTVSDEFNLNTGVFKLVEAEIRGEKLILIATYKSLVIVNKQSGKVVEMKQIEDPINNVEVDHLENIWLETVSRGVYKCRYDSELEAFRYYTYYGNKNDSSLPVKIKLFKSGGRIIFLGDDSFWTYNENEDRLTPNVHLNECFKSVTDLKKIVHIHNELSWAITSSSVHRFLYDGYIARILDSYKIEADNLSLINAYENIAILDDFLSMICLDAGFILHTAGWEIKETPQLPVPVFESIQTGSIHKEPRFIVPGGNPEIPYNYNDLTFHFTVSNTFGSGLLVQYRLTGVDNDWSEPVRTNKITYDRLLKGEYTFEIRSTDGLGNYSDIASLSFSILPPWYLTYWAYLLYIVGISGILYLIWVMILRRYRNLHLQKIRAREAQYLRMMNQKLLNEIEEKNAEIFTQTSFIIQKNELILKLKNIVDEFCAKNTNRSLIPLYQKMNTLLSNNMDSEEDWKMFLIKFEQKHQGFFKRLKAIHPELTNNDLRLCACLKLNLDTKDIASLMNLSVRAIENNRYRLRKKLNLETSQNLNEYFMGID